MLATCSRLVGVQLRSRAARGYLANWESLTSVRRISDGVALFAWLSDLAKQPPRLLALPLFLRGMSRPGNVPLTQAGLLAGVLEWLPPNIGSLPRQCLLMHKIHGIRFS
jgi:hypothetical protein